jgi:DNA-binding MarR family transcriptional regulator
VLAEPGELGLVLGEGQADDDQADAETPASRVLDALAEGPLRQKEIEAATGLPKSTLSRTVNALIGSGTLVRQDDGTLAQVNDDTAATGA